MQNALFDPKMQMTKKLTIFFLKGKSEPKDKEFFILNFSIKKKREIAGGKSTKKPANTFTMPMPRPYAGALL